MKITFLGTGAADWKLESRKDGEFFRRFTSALINDDLLIDPGPHIFDFREKSNLPHLYDGVTDILVTHAHGDHYCGETVRRLTEAKPRRMWCRESLVSAALSDRDKRTAVSFGNEYKVGKYSVIPINSNHMPEGATLNSFAYIISDGEKELFYGLDGAWIQCTGWQLLRRHRLDCAVFDVTLGDVVGDSRIFEHNNIRMTEIILETFRVSGVLKPEGLAVGTHFSRYTHENHEKLTARLGEFGMKASFDGCVYEF